MLTCPVCRGRSIRRSTRRNLIEKMQSLMGRYPYRCFDCQTRFFEFRVPHKSGAKSVKATYVLPDSSGHEFPEDDEVE